MVRDDGGVSPLMVFILAGLLAVLAVVVLTMAAGRAPDEVARSSMGQHARPVATAPAEPAT